MNFQQLRIIRETVRNNFNLTEAANALNTSQSGVSKHIKDLEDELGIELFVRRGKRLLGLTEPGQEMVAIVERILLDTQNIKKLGEQFTNRDRGQLVVATTHTQARYTLPPIVTAFKKEYPKVNLALNEASPAEIVSMLLAGHADIGIATEALQDAPDLAAFPYYAWHHGVVVPREHPLANEKLLTLEKIAEWPIVTYQRGYTGRARIDAAFEKAEIIPNIVMSALDADVIKAYVELELGIGIIASMAFSAERDPHLRLLDARHLFAGNTSRVAVRRGSYLRGYAYRFIELCSPKLDEATIRTVAVGGEEA
jgi:LysR family transcriptional regulator, cys regulon transcriptional activator